MSKIQDYAIIGNGRSAALISRQGSLDWLCWPRFDSPSLFAALLDEEKGGRFSIAPTSYNKVTRNYIEGTPILETRFHSESGILCLSDFSPVTCGTELEPEHEIIRRVECESGEVEVKVVYQPRPDYARASFTWHEKGSL